MNLTKFPKVTRRVSEGLRPPGVMSLKGWVINYLVNTIEESKGRHFFFKYRLDFLNAVFLVLGIHQVS